MFKRFISWFKSASWIWIKSNWLLILIVGLFIGFILMETFSMASQVSTLNDVLNDKTDEITSLKLEIVDMEADLKKMNDALTQAQQEIEQNTQLFWTKFNQIKIDAQNQTPEQVLEGWQNSWPGGKKK